MKTKLIALLQPVEPMTPEELIVYCARVSNPSNQNNHDTSDKLIKYCIKNKHWSVFEQGAMTIEITTSLAIATQILRHRSFQFQQFSGRYAQFNFAEPIELRKQAESNRQSSTDVIENEQMNLAVIELLDIINKVYNGLLQDGVARECARFILPQCTQTTLYMTGNIRSWIHYLQVRLTEHTQKEHRLIAEQILEIFKQHYPVIASAIEEMK